MKISIKSIFVMFSIVLVFFLTSCAHRHIYKVTMIEESTCVKEGIKEYKCRGCDDIKIDSINKTDHSFVSGICQNCNMLEEKNTIVTQKQLIFKLSKDSNYYIVNGIDEKLHGEQIGKIVIPENYNGKPVKEIGSNFLKGIINSFDIEIPKCLTKIDVEYFHSISYFNNMYYCGTITDWCKLEFDNYENYINVPNNFYFIDSDNKFNKLDHIVIPESVTAIGQFQFYKAKDIRYVEIPTTVTKINDYAFGCNIEKLYYKGTLEDWCNIDFISTSANPSYRANEIYMLDENNEYYKVTTLNIPNSIQVIKQHQFVNFVGVTKITIPETVVEIGNLAFGSCSNLEEVIIEENSKLTTIKEDAFLYCDKIKTIVLPSSLKTIEKNAFGKIEGIENVYFNGTIDDFCKIEFADSNANPLRVAEKFYVKDENNQYYQVTDLIIPNTVTSIGDYQFFGCSFLTEVFIPDSVTSIGAYAFSECKNLESIEISNSVTSIASFAFKYCSKLKEVIFEENIKITSIEEETFYRCKELESIVIPDGVTKIGTSAFEYCENMKSITLPSTLVECSQMAFHYCYRIENIYFKGTITNWCNITFDVWDANPMYYAKHFNMLDKNNEWFEVTEIRIPDDVTEIKSFTFINLTTIIKIYIPKTVTTIFSNAFESLKNATIYCEAKTRPENWQYNWQIYCKEVRWNRISWYY